MKLNTICLQLVALVIVITVTLGDNQPDLIDSTEHARPPTNFKPAQNWLRRLVQGARQGLGKFGFPLEGSV